MSPNIANGHEARRRRTRRALLDSALHLFESQGYSETTVAEIVHRAGVSERTFYVHFPAKEDLLFSHVQDFAELAWRVAHEADSPRPVDRVHAAVQAMIDAACRGDVARLARIRVNAALGGEIPRSLAAQLMNLARGLATRIAAETDTPVETVAPMVGAAIGAVEGAGLMRFSDVETGGSRHEEMSRALNAALHGFRPQSTVDP
ncbi:TetR/AcrR family transcriptional regulator [Microbacterium murale]|uniref:AcrR family transcriptional regulator n=1 Tax=Microbacterium murale TaxID=1081040 RepID=A0ABU0P612_9MICO|nr:TetR/AcrR family transcriptional regulator [Microbacterium murale]MDQ0642767.1 AcrR family transcriptional regulator [Microbacterium murale]